MSEGPLENISVSQDQAQSQNKQGLKNHPHLKLYYQVALAKNREGHCLAPVQEAPVLAGQPVLASLCLHSLCLMC